MECATVQKPKPWIPLAMSLLFMGMAGYTDHLYFMALFMILASYSAVGYIKGWYP